MATLRLAFCVLLGVVLRRAGVRGERRTAFERIRQVNAGYDFYRSNRIWQADIKRPRAIVGLKNTNGGAPIRYKNGLWRGGVIPYTLGSSISRDRRMTHLLRGAMAEWEKHTCVRFRPRSNQTDYIEFYYGDGCNSDVGRVGGRQTTSLGRGCGNHAIILHELGHIIGFWHEQNRPDRDDYVTIKKENIIERFKFAFDKYSSVKIDSLGVPYDYFSVMHYDAKAFSKNHRPTIVSKARGVDSFGNTRLSPLDIKQANLLYDCPNYPDFPQDFEWKISGVSSNKTNCLRMLNSQAAGWGDNGLCFVGGKRSLGLRFSSSGPVARMKCLHITNPAAPAAWARTYLCWPRDSIYEFTWRTREPEADEMARCLQLTEPHDPLWGDDGHWLCGTRESEPVDGQWGRWASWSPCSRRCAGGMQSRTRSCSDPAPSNGGKRCVGRSVQRRHCNQFGCAEWPRFPDDFSFYKRVAWNESQTCIQVYDRHAYATWRLYVFCSSSLKRDPELYWSDRGVKPRTRCTRIFNPAEKTKGSWDDNYLCVPTESPFRFYWSYVGPIPGKACLQWFAKDGRDGWNQTFLCTDAPPSVAAAATTVDGSWSEWGPWSACSQTCDQGIQRRVRSCSNPSPKNGGHKCLGPNTAGKLCTHMRCPVACGKKFRADQGQFMSPNHPSKYPSNGNCSWLLQVEHGHLVQLNFTTFQLQDSPSCARDSVKIYDGPHETDNLLGSFCGSDLPPDVTSSSNVMLVKMETDSVSNRAGFSASWDSVEDSVTQMPERFPGCSGNFHGASGTLTSPPHPKNISGPVLCAWTLSVGPSQMVSLHIGHFGVSLSEQSCDKFSIEVFDGNSSDAASLGKFCGNGMPGSLEASSNQVYIMSRTMGPEVGHRFFLTWRGQGQIAMTTTAPPKKAVCEPGWILHAIGATTYCYKVERLARTWNAARKQCQWLNADLLSISGPEEQAFVNKHLLSSYFMWIGYNDQNQEGVWRWTDGSESVFSNWAAGDPNDGGFWSVTGEDCGVLKRNGLWNDYPCTHRFRFACKAKANYMMYAKGIQGT